MISFLKRIRRLLKKVEMTPEHAKNIRFPCC